MMNSIENSAISLLDWHNMKHWEWISELIIADNNLLKIMPTEQNIIDICIIIYMYSSIYILD